MPPSGLFQAALQDPLNIGHHRLIEEMLNGQHFAGDKLGDHFKLRTNLKKVSTIGGLLDK